MQLLYDRRDLDDAERRGDSRLLWLRDLGANAIQDLPSDGEGFLFGYQLPCNEFAALVDSYPGVHDRPADRGQLIHLEDILSKLELANISVPTPRTWILRIDDPLPLDLTFPLFVRTSMSSWKRGGHSSKVRNPQELEDECELFRRSFRWDATILAREWINLSVAGEWRYGSVPVEIRVWIVDAHALAWSFHYLHFVPNPQGFPPSVADLDQIAEYAQHIAAPFSSRLIAADFVRDTAGKWHFLEAGPGACSGTSHEYVFKSVASKLIGRDVYFVPDKVGGLFPR